MGQAASEVLMQGRVVCGRRAVKKVFLLRRFYIGEDSCIHTPPEIYPNP